MTPDEIDRAIAEAIEPEPAWGSDFDYPYAGYGNVVFSTGRAWYRTPDGTPGDKPRPFSTSWEAAECLEQYLRERGYFVQVNFWQDETTVHITDKTSCVVLGGASGGPGDLPGALARAAAEVLKGKKEGE